VSSAVGTPRTKSLGRAIQLLGAVATRPGGASASELGRIAGLPRSTAARTLRTLADFGLVEEAAEGAGWVLGYELVRLARAADPYRRLVESAAPVLGRLRDTAGESALLAVPRSPSGMEILLQLDPERHVGVTSWVGFDVPLYASSAGKILLAQYDPEELQAWLDSRQLTPFTHKTITDRTALRVELARVRQHGWAELVDELEDGLAAISVPVWSRGAALGGGIVAAIGISGPTFRLGRNQRRHLLPALQAAAIEIEQSLPRQQLFDE
jgi:IclR family transcriptional regulator, acetate operon repressor